MSRKVLLPATTDGPDFVAVVNPGSEGVLILVAFSLRGHRKRVASGKKRSDWNAIKNALTRIQQHRTASTLFKYVVRLFVYFPGMTFVITLRVFSDLPIGSGVAKSKQRDPNIKNLPEGLSLSSEPNEAHICNILLTLDNCDKTSLFSSDIKTRWEKRLNSTDVQEDIPDNRMELS